MEFSIQVRFIGLISLVASYSFDIDWKTSYMQKISDSLIHQNNRYTEPLIKVPSTATTEVSISMDIRSLIEFDVSAGTLKMLAIFRWTWSDKSLIWSRPEIDLYTTKTRLPISTIWTPVVYIQNTAAGIDDLATADSAVVTYLGEDEYETPQVLDILCDPDITKYPFDEHICAINLEPLSLDPGFKLSSPDDIDMSNFWENPEWTVSKVNVTNHEDRYVDFYFRIKRHVFFLTLNLVAPVLVLAALNLFVFVIPHDSGERISFSITMMLAFVVFLSATSEALPESSTSTCIFNIFLMVQLVESSLITVTVILLSWFHHMPEETHVPLSFRRFLSWTRRQKQIQHQTEQVQQRIDPVEERITTSSFIGISGSAVEVGASLEIDQIERDKRSTPKMRDTPSPSISIIDNKILDIRCNYSINQDMSQIPSSQSSSRISQQEGVQMHTSSAMRTDIKQSNLCPVEIRRRRSSNQEIQRFEFKEKAADSLKRTKIRVPWIKISFVSSFFRTRVVNEALQEGECEEANDDIGWVDVASRLNSFGLIFFTTISIIEKVVMFSLMVHGKGL